MVQDKHILSLRYLRFKAMKSNNEEDVEALTKAIRRYKMANRTIGAFWLGAWVTFLIYTFILLWYLV